MAEENISKETILEKSIKSGPIASGKSLDILNSPFTVGIVTEDVAMIPPEILEKHQIELVKILYDWPPEKELPGENLYQKMREADRRGIEVFPKTSQASPKSYLDAFRKQLQRFDKVICISLSSKVSGSYNSACQAKKLLKEEEGKRVYIIDSLTVANSQFLLVLKAIELIRANKKIDEVIGGIQNFIPKTHFYFMFEDPKWIESLGRISKSQADWVRRMKKIKLHPLIEIKDGAITKGGVVFAKDMAEAVFKKILKESEKIKKEGKRIRIVIGHADNFEQAEKLKKLAEEKIGAEVPFVGLGPSVICAATGPGTLLVGWSPIEG